MFYSLAVEEGVGAAIRRASTRSAESLYYAGRATGQSPFKSGSGAHGVEDALVYTGPGAILALAVDADDNLVFSMDDSFSDTGALFSLKMERGGVPVIEATSTGYSTDDSSTATGTRAAATTSTSAATGTSSSSSSVELSVGPTADAPILTNLADGSSGGYNSGVSSRSSSSLSSSSGYGVGSGGAVPLASDLGPFLPGVAVCPITGDLYVARGHAGLIRIIRKADGSFEKKVRRYLRSRACLFACLLEYPGSTILCRTVPVGIKVLDCYRAKC